MDKFEFMYMKTVESYNKLEDAMAFVYEKLQKYPENEELKKVLEYLEYVASSFKFEQKEFLDIYDPKEYEADSNQMKMEKFDYITKLMIKNYDEVENIMRPAIEKLHEEPENEELKDILARLGNALLGIITKRKYFTEIYAIEEYKNMAMDRLNLEERNLTENIDNDLQAKTR